MTGRSVKQRLQSWLTASFVALTCFAGLSACTPVHEPLNLAGNSWLGYQPMFIAKELFTDLEKDAEIHLHNVSTATSVMRFMAEGQLDGGFMTLDEALAYQAADEQPICIGMVVDVSLGADAIVMHKDWREGSQPLKIAHEASAVGTYLLAKAQQQGKFDNRQLDSVVASPTQQIQLFNDHQVDGIVGYYPTLAQLQGLPTETVFDSADVPGDIIDLLVIKQHVWQQHQDHIKQHINSIWQRVMPQVMAKDKGVMAIAQRNTQMTEAELEVAASKVDWQGAMDTEQFDVKPAVTKLASYLKRSGFIERAVTLDYCVNTEE